MDITFHTLTLRNFLSYGNNETSFNLNFKDPTLIFGENYDSVIDGQVDSNGAGKTTILNGIMYALYGKLLSEIKMTDVINNINKKDMEVSLVFEINKTFYKIIRFRKNRARGGEGVILLKSDSLDFSEAQDITPDSIINTNKKILDITNIPYEICARIIVFSATYKPFLSLPVSHISQPNQTDIIEELFNLTILTKKSKTLKGIIKNDKLDLDNLILLNYQLEKEKIRYNEQLKTVRMHLRNWDEVKVKELQLLELEKVKLNSIDFDKELKLLNANNKIENKVSKLEDTSDVIKHDIKTHQRQLNLAVEWESSTLEKTQKAKVKVEGFKHIDFDMNRELFTLFDKIDSNINKTNICLDSIKSDITQTAKSIIKLKTEKKALKNSTCPYCNQPFEGAKKKLKAIVTELANFKTVDTCNESKVKSKETKITKLRKQLKSVKDSLEFNNVRQLEKTFSEYTLSVQVLEDSENQDNPYTVDLRIGEMADVITTLTKKLDKCGSDISDFENTLINNRSEYIDKEELFGIQTKATVMDSKIESLEDSENPHIVTVDNLAKIELDESKTDEINTLAKRIEHSGFLLKLLTKKDSFIRKALLNKSIPFLNQRLKIYLDKLGLPHRVQFNHDMTTSITQFGNEINYANLSSGQKARVNLALSFAFRDVLQVGHSKVNFCILDECLDVGLSNVGVLMAAKMLKSIAKEEELSMFIISHRDEITSMYDRKLVIQLKHGFSNIKKED